MARLRRLSDDDLAAFIDSLELEKDYTATELRTRMLSRCGFLSRTAMDNYLAVLSVGPLIFDGLHYRRVVDELHSKPRGA